MLFTRFSMIAFACVTFLASTSQLHAQEIFAESFEEAPGTSYLLSTEIDDGFFDFFGRFAVPDVDNGARDDFTLGFDGGFAIFGQDQDGTGEDATQTITLPGIDIAGQTDLSTTISFGALDSEAADFFNYEALDDELDGIQIFAEIDGGGQVLIGEFLPDPALDTFDGNGSSLRLDTDGDGIGDGTVLTVDLADFTFPIEGTGSSLELTIAFTSTDSFEPLVVDNVRVSAGEDSGVLLGDINLDGAVNFLDISGLIAILGSNGFQAEADVDESGMVTFADIGPFIALLSGS